MIRIAVIAAAVLALARPALAAAAWNAKTSHEEYVVGDAAVIAAIIDHEEKNGYVASYASDRDNLRVTVKMSPRGGNGSWWLGHICAALQNLNWGTGEWTVKVDGLDGAGNPMECKF
jgi:hypothetical protein